VGQRGILFICKDGYGLDEILGFYNKKYGKLVSNLIHIQKSLVYFNDAEPEGIPKMLKKVKWEEIKEYFENEVKKLTKNKKNYAKGA